MTSSQDKYTTDPEIESLSALEKAALLSGESTWQSRAVPRLGVRQLWMSDGPHGIRRQAGSADHLGINAALPATCFPTAATVANSWNPALAQRLGLALGREASHLGVDVVLGPGLNIKRSPLGGRNFEYYSEDPYLTGKLAASFVRGIQTAGVAACPKHFAVNSQETRRMTSNSVVDEGTLRDLYLTAFELVVKEATPLTIMSSYNLVNGTYAHEHAHLLQEILRDEWGFEGSVLTDWGGGNDPRSAILAGGTLEMPSPGFDSAEEILAGPVDLIRWNQRVTEVIRLSRAVAPQPTDESIFAEHHQLALEAAEQSVVLLRNERDLLPLAKGTRVAVIGDFAFEPRYQGAGSSLVNPTQLVSPIEALQSSDLDVVATARGFARNQASSSDLVAEAVAAAAVADVVLVYLGLDEFLESEGKDRDHLNLHSAQTELLTSLLEVNRQVVVILAAGAPVELPWLEQIPALVHGYLGGQAGAQAVVNVLTGTVNPSGHLAETYPLSLDDTPTAGRFPAREHNALYLEGPYIGYRYYQSANVPVRFPFGFGLSYTTFSYSNVSADSAGVSVTVTNTGDRVGTALPQVYVSAPPEVHLLGPCPKLKLASFARVELSPGQSERVHLPFDEYSFRVFDRNENRWKVVGGKYLVSLSTDVDSPITQIPIEIAGQPVSIPHPAAKIEAYARARVGELTPADFEVLLGQAVPANPARAPLTKTSPLSDLEVAPSWLGRAIYRGYFARNLRKNEAAGVSDLNLLFQYGMPFRAIAKMSGGMADSAMVEAILEVVNGKFFRGVSHLVARFFANRSRQRKLATQFKMAAAGHDQEK